MIGGESSRRTEASPEEEFEVGVAHSSELQFEHGSDISDGGMTVLVFRKQASTYALVTSDSNNAVMGLRQSVIDELKRDERRLDRAVHLGHPQARPRDT